jgi:hypothetical protein
MRPVDIPTKPRVRMRGCRSSSHCDSELTVGDDARTSSTAGAWGDVGDSSVSRRLSRKAISETLVQARGRDISTAERDDVAMRGPAVIGAMAISRAHPYNRSHELVGGLCNSLRAKRNSRWGAPSHRKHESWLATWTRSRCCSSDPCAHWRSAPGDAQYPLFAASPRGRRRPLASLGVRWAFALPQPSAGRFSPAPTLGR